MMGRPFAACLGSIAFVAQIILGVMRGVESETTLTRAILSLLACSAVGLVIGKLADDLVRDNIEAHYRRRVEQLKEKQRSEETANLT